MNDDVSTAIDRLRQICNTGSGYGGSILDVYQCRMEGEFYDDLHTLLRDHARLKAETDPDLATIAYMAGAADARDSGLHVRVDPVVNCTYIYLVGKTGKGEAVRQIRAGDNIVIDLNRDGQVIGIELLDKALLHPQIAARAKKKPGD